MAFPFPQIVWFHERQYPTFNMAASMLYYKLVHLYPHS